MFSSKFTGGQFLLDNPKAVKKTARLLWQECGGVALQPHHSILHTYSASRHVAVPDKAASRRIQIFRTRKEQFSRTPDWTISRSGRGRREKLSDIEDCRIEPLGR